MSLLEKKLILGILDHISGSLKLLHRTPKAHSNFEVASKAFCNMLWPGRNEDLYRGAYKIPLELELDRLMTTVWATKRRVGGEEIFGHMTFLTSWEYMPHADSGTSFRGVYLIGLPFILARELGSHIDELDRDMVVVWEKTKHKMGLEL